MYTYLNSTTFKRNQLILEFIPNALYLQDLWYLNLKTLYKPQYVVNLCVTLDNRN